MASGHLSLTIVTPERALVDRMTCDEVTLPGERGELGILPSHTPLITLLGVGIVRWTGVEGTGAVAVRGGFAEIAGDVVRVLAEVAAAKGGIDPAEAARDKARAEEARASVQGEEQLESVNAEAAFAEARLRIASGG